MGGCNGWVFERFKLAQANLLPMGLPHLVSQYSLSPSQASPSTIIRPALPPASGQGRSPAGQLLPKGHTGKNVYISGAFQGAGQEN